MKEFFGFGYQAIPLFSWFYVPILLLYTRNKPYSNIISAYFVSSIGFSTGFLGTFRATIDGARFPLAWFLLITSFILNIILIITLTAERYVTSHSQCIYKRVLLFPAVWTGLWFLVGRLGPLGDYPSLSTVLIQWSDFSQIASLGGRSVLDFIVAVSGTIVFEFSSFPIQALSMSDGLSSVLLADSEVDEEYTADEQNTSRKRQYISLLVHPITIYSVILTLAFTYGGFCVNVRPNSLYQVTYPEYIPKTVPVGCVVGPGDTYPELQTDHDVWFNKSAELVGDGAKLVIWSEITTVVENLEDEQVFIQRARDFALLHKVYLGVTYSLSGPIKKNKFVLVTKTGDIGIDYNKAHPVPGVETQAAGPNVLQYIDTEEFGRIGGAICFDFNFANFIGQASTHKVDVMLQPSWTWGPIGTYHQQGNILRPVENGFTLFRCVSQGVSGIFEPTLNGVFNQKVASNNVEKYVFYLPIQKRLVTLYSYIGDFFGYVCLMASVVLLVTTYRDSRRLHQLSI
ncbi:hypothetical protein MFLAVUS_001127 [Mucor flavus]|uniref:CN hydrolase domain-containing protein n=1 Tax=Mucor flavus TaxID=439312 RepID=A0ABP9YLK6_9FUNG